MTFTLPWHLHLMGILYVIAGLNHFRNPRLYLKIIPPYFPKPKLLNYLSGIAEIILGVGICIPMFSQMSAWGIIALQYFLPICTCFQIKKQVWGCPKLFYF